MLLTWFITLDVNLGQQAEIALVRFLSSKVTLFLLCMLYSWMEVTTHNPHSSSKELCPPHGGQSISMNSWNSSALEIFLLSPIIHLFNLFISPWIHRYLHYWLWSNIIFVVQIFPTLEAHSLGPCFSLTYPQIVGFFKVLPYFLTLKNASGSSLCISCPSPRISPFSNECWFLY